MKGFIACILLSVLCFTAISCSGDVPGVDGETMQTAKTNSETEADYLETLPKKNYEGDEFTIMGKYDESGAFNFPREVEDGDFINEALFKRAREVEEMYNIKYIYVKTGNGGETVTKVTENVLTGDIVYDMIQGSMLTCTGLLLKQGCLSNVLDLTYINLDNLWWNTNIKKDLLIDGKIFFITGVIMYEHYREAACLTFNKQMAEDYQIGNLYDYVFNDTWTLDKFIDTTKNVSQDINGDGIMNIDDQYGIFIGDITAYDFYFGSAMRITYHDTENNLYFEDTPSQKTIEIVEKLSEFFGTKNDCIDIYDYQGVDAIYSVFSGERSLYYSTRMSGVLQLRSEPFEFGILPIPKYNESQETFYSYANPWEGSSIAFPLVLKDKEMVSIITEAMAYKSKLYLEPVMFDNLLKTRASRDNESLKMLDIIYNTKTFDLCDIFEWGGLNYMIRNAVLARDGSNTRFVSDYAATVANADASMKDLIKVVSEIK